MKNSKGKEEKVYMYISLGLVKSGLLEDSSPFSFVKKRRHEVGNKALLVGWG